MGLTLSTRQFHYHPAERLFTAEASDLGGFPVDRLFLDACDVGFTLVNARTGTTCQFALSHEEHDAEGDLRWIDYRAYPETRNLTVRIWND